MPGGFPGTSTRFLEQCGTTLATAVGGCMVMQPFAFLRSTRVRIVCG